MDKNEKNYEQQNLFEKIAELSLNETDDDIQNHCIRSSQKDERIKEILRNIPSEISQMYQCLGPVYKIKEKFQISYQKDGSIYFGEENQGKKTGTGIQIWPELGNILDGNWVNDELNGYCRMLYYNKDIFECEFQQGRANGFGIFQCQKKIVKGIWVDNKLQGEGMEFRKDGSKYYGQFKDGQKNGQGIMYFNDGCKYEGRIRNNRQDGVGIMIWNDSSQINKGKWHLLEWKWLYFEGICNGLLNQWYQFEEEIQKDWRKKIQRIIYINESGSKLIIEKIRKQ